MSRILMAGLPVELTSWLEHRLGGVSVLSTHDGQETLDELAKGECSLLIIDNGIANPAAPDVVKQARCGQGMSTLPVAYCLGPGMASDVFEQMAQPLGAVRFLSHPIDREEIARLAAQTLSLPPAPPKMGWLEKRLARFAILTKIWEEVRGTVMGRLELLEQATATLLEGNLDNELRLEAEGEAHKLGGLLGTFGYSEGTRLAKKMERFFAAGSPLGQAEAISLSGLVVSLRNELEQPLHLNLWAEPEAMNELP